jgi:UDP-glucose 4-epimerase
VAGILVTGSAGYIGSHFLSHFDVSLHTCDLLTGADFGEIEGQEFGTVIHLAAHASVTESLLRPDECLDNNAFKLIPFLTRNKIRRFVFASTGGALYGEKEKAKEEEANWDGCISPYGQSKYIAEQIIRRLQPNHVILRLGNVYGGNDIGRRELAACAHFRLDDPIVVYGTGQTRDFIHIDAVCSAIMKAAYGDMVGTFNIGSGFTTDVHDWALRFSYDRNVPVAYAPARAGEVVHTSLDITKAQKAGLCA